MSPSFLFSFSFSSSGLAKRNCSAPRRAASGSEGLDINKIYLPQSHCNSFPCIFSLIPLISSFRVFTVSLSLPFFSSHFCFFFLYLRHWAKWVTIFRISNGQVYSLFKIYYRHSKVSSAIHYVIFRAGNFDYKFSIVQIFVAIQNIENYHSIFLNAGFNKVSHRICFNILKNRHKDCGRNGFRNGFK